MAKNAPPKPTPKLVKAGQTAIIITSQGIYNLVDLICVCPYSIWYKHGADGFIMRFRQSAEFIEISKEHYEGLIADAMAIDVNLPSSPSAKGAIYGN